MVKPASTDKILAATGTAWPDWITLLDNASARELDHTQIAKTIFGTGKASGWWSQMITVAYEQHIGRRLPGQRADGRFNASVARTLDGETEALFVRWCALLLPETEILGSKRKAEPTTSTTSMGHNWRCRLQDGGNVVVTFSPAAGKTRIAAQHEGLATFDRIAEAKAFWSSRMEQLNQ